MKVIGFLLLVVVVVFSVFEIIGFVRDIQARRRKNKDENNLKE